MVLSFWEEDTRDELAAELRLARQVWLLSAESLTECKDKERTAAEAAETAEEEEERQHSLGSVYRKFVVERARAKLERQERATASAAFSLTINEDLHHKKCTKYRAFRDALLARRVAANRHLSQANEFHIANFLY